MNHLGNWKNSELGDFVTLKRGFDLPQQKREDGQVPIFSSSGITGTHSTAMVKAPGVITGRYGTIGEVFYAAKDFWPLNTTLFVEDFHGNDAKFIYYFLKTLEWSKFTSASAVPGINRNTVHKEIVSLPDIETQRRIASTLSMFDEKIKINTEINDNLYAQAKAIFAQRFIGIETIPDGWKKGNLLDIANYLNGLAMQKFRPRDDEVGLPVLKIKELRQGSCDVSSELCSPSIKPEYIVHDGDVIFSWSGSLLVDIWCGGTCGLNQHLFKVTSETYDQWFYYLWTAHHLERFIAIAADKATTMGHIKRGELEKAEVLIPSEKDYKEISSLMNPLFNLIIANRIEARKLAELRDELLPKLMSGEIDVSEVSV